MTHVLYNPFADNGHGKQNSEKLGGILKSDELKYYDITKLDLAEFLNRVPDEEKIVISGGDGTVHYILNHCEPLPERPLYYFPTGSGNDFKTDVRERESGDIILLNPYLKNLPTVTINGKKLRFFNGVGYGIDGYCCEEGDKQRKQSVDSINYTAIAIKGMLKYFKPRGAVVVVDGVEHKYSHVWLAPTMNGRFYGGGMMIAPDQDRLGGEGLVTAVIMHCPSKLITFAVFPSIFKGKHVKHKKIVEIFTGHEITVTFDKPTPLQVDGETFTNVLTYSVSSAVKDTYDEKQTANV